MHQSHSLLGSNCCQSLSYAARAVSAARSVTSVPRFRIAFFCAVVLVAFPAHGQLPAEHFAFPVAGGRVSSSLGNSPNPVAYRGCNPTAGNAPEGDWYVCNDFGSYCETCDPGFAGLHPGEDLNLACPSFNPDGNVRDRTCDLGLPVAAVANGEVVYSGLVSPSLRYGVIIRHRLPRPVDVAPYVLAGTVFPAGEDRMRRDVYSAYLHLENVSVSEDEQVAVGQQIGTIGSANGPHLHLEMRWKNLPFFPHYRASPQALTSTGLLSPSAFLDGHLCPFGLRAGAMTSATADAHLYEVFDRGFNRERFNPELVDRPSIGCPAVADRPDEPGFMVSDRGLWIQHFFQPRAELRFSGSDGWTAMVHSPTADQTFLLRSGFWGVYRCLSDQGGRMAGARYLGAPIDEEHPLGAMPTDSVHADRLACLRDGPCAPVTRQNFERGYMEWAPDERADDFKVHLHINGLDGRSTQALVDGLDGCVPPSLHVVPNPPVAPQITLNPRVSVYPSAGRRGTLFQQDGSGFAPNGNVTLVFQYPDGNLAQVPKITDGQGSYRHAYQSHGETPVGTYFYWGVDDTTGIQSARVTFEVTAASLYLDGHAYKGDARPDICYFMDGTCRVIASEPVYWQMFPGDIGFDRMVEIPQGDFDALVASAPCVIGEDYQNNARPGCILHDVSLDGENNHFVILGGAARRMSESAARRCFDARRIFSFQFIAWAERWVDDHRRYFEFEDAPDHPYYCDPTVGGRTSACGECAEQTESCDAATCRIEAGPCLDRCGADQVCVDGSCAEVARLEAGQIVSPPSDTTVSNEGFEVEWTTGRAADGSGTGTGLYCRVADGDWSLRRGFGADPRAWLPIYEPGTTVSCKVRTRLNNNFEEWVDSPIATWSVASTYAAMEVTAIRLHDEPIANGCDDLHLTASISNAGDQTGAWRVRAWIHPSGGDPESAEAIAARRAEYVSLDPGASTDVEFAINLDAPLPLALGVDEITVIVDDSSRHIGVASRRTIPAIADDDEAPQIDAMQITGYAGDTVEVLPGRTHSVLLSATDRYAIDRVALSWRHPGGAWTEIMAETLPTDGCRTTFGAWLNWSIPADLAEGLRLEVRGQVWDRAGLMAERFDAVTTRSNTAPVVEFLRPHAGEEITAIWGDTGGCLPVEFIFVPGVEIVAMTVGIANGDGTRRDYLSDIRPIPESGRVETCIRISAVGDDLRVFVRIEDANALQHWFSSPAIISRFPPPPAPWGRQQLEPTQRPLDRLDPPEQIQTNDYAGLDVSADTVRLYRTDARRWLGGESQTETRINQLTFDRRDLRLTNTTPILAPMVDVVPDGYYSAWFRYSVDVDRFFGHYVRPDPPCEDRIAQRCDYGIYLRDIVGGVAVDYQRLGVYADRVWHDAPWLRGYLLGPSGARLAFVDNAPEDVPRTELHRNSGAGWSRVGAVDGYIVHSFAQDGLVFGVRHVRTDEEFVVDVLEIDERTGAITGQDAIARQPVGSVLSWMARDKQTNATYLMTVNYDSWQLKLARYQAGQWVMLRDRLLPDTWRGEAVTRHSPQALLAGAGRVYLMTQIGLDNRSQDLIVPLGPQWTIDLDGAFVDTRRVYDDISTGAVAVGSDGRLARAFRCRWNFIDRLCFEWTFGIESDCYDGDLCTVDHWNPDTGACTFERVTCEQDGDACNGPEICAPESGECITDAGRAIVCDDGRLCNGVERCDSVTGECRGGTPLVVDDEIACTDDRCSDEEGSIVNEPIHAQCTTDRCHVARCAPADDDADRQTGCVLTEVVPDSDGLACTDDLCDLETGRTLHVVQDDACLIDGRCFAVGEQRSDNECEICVPAIAVDRWSAAEDEISCDDGRFCTTEDRCAGGRCVGQPRDCTSAIVDPLCQRPACDELGELCRVMPAADGASCEDGDVCNGRESCLDQRCVDGTPLALESDDPCVAFACDPETGISQVFTELPCDADDDACTVDDRCLMGACVSGDPHDCSGIAGPCREGICESVDGRPRCVPRPTRAVGDACDDGAACTAADVCNVDGECSGRAYACDSPGVCESVDGAACDGGGGCTYSAAIDGRPCAGGQCMGGLCRVDGDLCASPIELEPGIEIGLDLQYAAAGPPLDGACNAQPLSGSDVWLLVRGRPEVDYRVVARPAAAVDVALAWHATCDPGGCLEVVNHAGPGGEEALGPRRLPDDSDHRLQVLKLGPGSGLVTVRVVVDDEPPVCAVGDPGCPCGPGQSCDAPLVCRETRCVEPGVCPAGQLGCPCDEGDRCVEPGVCRARVCIADDCPIGTAGCPCGSQATCDDGLACDEETCEPPDCIAGTIGCQCNGNGMCDADLQCRVGTCVMCPAGTEHCACDDDEACDEGLDCRGALCAACPSGTANCACYGDGTCDEDLACRDEVCAICAPGSDGCPCYGNLTCDRGLECRGDVCARCDPGQLGCVCYGNDTCDDGGRCVDDQCVECPAGSEMCACYGNDSCDDDLQCEDGRCRVAPRDGGLADLGISDAASSDIAPPPAPDAGTVDAEIADEPDVRGADGGSSADDEPRGSSGCSFAIAGPVTSPGWALIWLGGLLFGIVWRKRANG